MIGVQYCLFSNGLVVFEYMFDAFWLFLFSFFAYIWESLSQFIEECKEDGLAK